MQRMTRAGWAAIAIAAFLVFGCAAQPALGEMGSAHDHADFKVYLNGQAYNFSQEKYMTPSGAGEECGGNSTLPAHLHDMDGNLAHKHATGVTWSYFFSTLNMSFKDGCLVLDTGEKYCETGSAKWRYFLNGSELGGLLGREITQGDRALFTYNASDSEIAAQIDSVTNESAYEETVNYCALPAVADKKGFQDGVQ
jgi:hypothetical protein